MIGGKVVDASTLAAYAVGDLAVATWLDVARWSGIALFLPELALIEARSVLPWAQDQFAELLDHPSVVWGPMTATVADQVARRLDDARVFDGMAGHVVHVARERGWPALSADPGRLLHVDREIEVDRL